MNVPWPCTNGANKIVPRTVTAIAFRNFVVCGPYISSEVGMPRLRRPRPRSADGIGKSAMSQARVAPLNAALGQRGALSLPFACNMYHYPFFPSAPRAEDDCGGTETCQTNCRWFGNDGQSFAEPEIV